MPKLSREGVSAPLTLGQSLAPDICSRSTMVRAPRGASIVDRSQAGSDRKKVPMTPGPLSEKFAPIRGPAHQDFRQDIMRARRIRADFAFGERILDLADDTSDDWYYNEKTGRLSVNKEVVLRSRVRIGVRQLHMARL